MLLRCQLQIEPVRRRYNPQEQQRLIELFGEPERWSQTLRPLLWENLTVSVPGFIGSTMHLRHQPGHHQVRLRPRRRRVSPQPALRRNRLSPGPRRPPGQQIPWSSEARYRLPLRVWKQMMDSFYPDGRWLYLRRDSFDSLYDYKTRHGIST